MCIFGSMAYALFPSDAKTGHMCIIFLVYGSKSSFCFRCKFQILCKQILISFDANTGFNGSKVLFNLMDAKSKFLALPACSLYRRCCHQPTLVNNSACCHRRSNLFELSKLSNSKYIEAITANNGSNILRTTEIHKF